MDIEPLDAQLWFEALERLEQNLKSAQPSILERHLRHAFHLVQLAPRPLRTLIRATCDEDAYEALLESGDLLGAAEALAGPPLSRALRDLGGQRVEAGVFLPGNPFPVLCSADSAPAALFGAWLRSLLTLKAFVRLPANEVQSPRPLRSRPIA